MLFQNIALKIMKNRAKVIKNAQTLSCFVDFLTVKSESRKIANKEKTLFSV